MAFLAESPASEMYLCYNRPEVQVYDGGDVQFQFFFKGGSPEAAREDIDTYGGVGMAEVWLVVGASTNAIWKRL